MTQYYVFVFISERDRAVLIYLADFSLLTEKQLRRLVFADLASATPCHRAIKRLLDGRLITRLDIRIVGSTGGNGSYVYKLSANGLRLCNVSPGHRSKLGVYAHTLAVADTFVALKPLEIDGRRIARYATEPEAWCTIGGVELRPDLRVEFEGTDPVFYEIDLATEKERALLGKLEAVYKAFHGYTEADQADFPVFPHTRWVTTSPTRVRLLERLMERFRVDGSNQLFSVTTLDELSTDLNS